MSKRKLLLITNGFPFGESEKSFLTTEFQHLREAFDVYVLARIVEPEQAQWEGIDRSRVSCTGISAMRPMRVLGQFKRSCVRKELVRACKMCGPKQALKRISAVLRYSARADTFQKTIEQVCREKNIDLIYTYWCTQATLASLRVKKALPGIRVVTRFHGYDLYHERTEENWQPFRHEIAQRCDQLIFASQSGKEYFLSHWGRAVEGKSIVSYLGCSELVPYAVRDEGALPIVSCSNLIPLKRVEYIIDALAGIPENVKVVWHHFGDGPLRQSLEDKAEKVLGKKENISWEFRGYVLNQQLQEHYRDLNARLFITTSSTEGVPVSIQEAFSLGVPVIATAVGGIPELVIDGHTGYLLPENPRIPQITEAVMKFWSLSREEKQKMADNARDMWKSNCDAEVNACRFVGLLKDLVSEG